MAVLPRPAALIQYPTAKGAVQETDHGEGHGAALLQERKRLALALFGDEYAGAHFWQ
jgi:hypothetical protein